MTRTRRLVFGGAMIIPLALLVELAIARPGGGDTYSGGGGHGGGGGSSGGGGDGADVGAILELIYWLVRLIIDYPQLGIPLLAVGIGYFAYSAYKQRQNRDWDSGPPVELRRATTLEAVKQADPDFSQVLFEDFAFRLFSTAHRVRHSAVTLEMVAPYVSPPARQVLEARDPVGEPVLSVVVGAMRIVRVDVPDAGLVRIDIELEANVSTAAHTYYSVESWQLARDVAQHTKPPTATRGFPCPNCSAPWQATGTGTQRCASCNQVVDNGRFDWVVADIRLRSIDERPPTLTEPVPERGTDLPTYRQPSVDRRLIELERADPAVTETALVQRLTMIYDELNRAWTNNDLRPVRGLVSDGLYDYLVYWVDAYNQQGLRNQLLEMRITHSTVAKVSTDRWYTAVTVRIWATGKDFVERVTGEHVRGSRSRDRDYSEYWTLIRSAARKGPPVTQRTCSNCGAPLQITMAGECEHCSAHVTAGEFDWVLSKIEQDDSYRG